jgi:hypothetical protein
VTTTFTAEQAAAVAEVLEAEAMKAAGMSTVVAPGSETQAKYLAQAVVLAKALAALRGEAVAA